MYQLLLENSLEIVARMVHLHKIWKNKSIFQRFIDKLWKVYTYQRIILLSVMLTDSRQEKRLNLSALRLANSNAFVLLFVAKDMLASLPDNENAGCHSDRENDFSYSL